MNKPRDIDEYIAAAAPEVRDVLKQVRNTIQKAAPRAEEKVSYGMPAFAMNGKVLVYFAAFKNHIGLYAAPTAHEAFRDEFSRYKTGKGSVQFPLDQPMPLKLIARVVKFKLQNLK
jgi:uncharacterized protein YdhG (YjbR/CyaY superfamily)